MIMMMMVVFSHEPIFPEIRPVVPKTKMRLGGRRYTGGEVERTALLAREANDTNDL